MGERLNPDASKASRPQGLAGSNPAPSANLKIVSGEVAEHGWKRTLGERVTRKGPWVQIPPSPPIRKWGVFKEETEGTFRRKIQAALF